MESGESTLTKKATRGVAWQSVLQVARQALSLISVSVLAHCVSPEAYGLVGLAGLIPSIFSTFQDLGTFSALVREPVLDDRFTSTVFWVNCLTGFAMFACAFALAGPVAVFFRNPALIPIVEVMAVFFIVYSLGVVPNALLTRKMAFGQISIAQFAGAVIGTITAVTLAVSGKGAWSLVFGAFANYAGTVAGYWVFGAFRVRWTFDSKSIRRVASYGLNLSGYGIVNYVSRNADNLLVGRYLGSGPLGLYQMAYMFLTYPLINFTQMITQVVFPAMSQLQDDDERFRRVFIRASVLIALVMFPAMFGLFVTAGPFVQVILGAKKWGPVVGLIMVFAPLCAAQSVATVCGVIYNVKGSTDRLFRWGAFSSVLFVISFAVGLRWGIQGVASCYAIMWSILALPGMAIPLRLIHLPLREYLGHFGQILTPALGMTAVAAAWLHGLKALGVGQPAVLLFSTAAVGAITYVGLLWWRKPPVIDDLRNLLEQSGNWGRSAATFLPA